MRTNGGHCPADAKGKRIRGILRSGLKFGFEPVSNAAPAGWSADMQNWRLTGSDFDIAEFEVIGG
jgi:hypothetical protein